MRKDVFVRILLMVIGFLNVIVINVFAQSSSSIYGSSSVYVIGYVNNTEYLNKTGSNEYDYYLNQNLSISFDTGNMSKAVTDINLQGTGTNTISNIAPVTIDIKQLYLQIPIGSSGVFYCGKRIKEMGTSEMFSLVNRINPAYFNNIELASYGAGLIEGDWFPFYWMNLTSVVYFKEMDTHTEWKDLSFLFQSDFLVSPLTLSLYFYYESYSNVILGVSSAFQLNYWKLNAEYLNVFKDNVLLYKGTQLTESDEPYCNLITLGITYQRSTFSASFEYFYNGKGYTPEKFNNIYNYILDYPGNKTDTINRINSAKWIMPQNLGIKFNYTSDFIPDMSIGGKGILSFIDFEEFTRYAGVELSFNINYAISQSVSTTLFGTGNFGGERSYVKCFESDFIKYGLFVSLLY